jgi:hypothetical protein
MASSGGGPDRAARRKEVSIMKNHVVLGVSLALVGLFVPACAGADRDGEEDTASVAQASNLPPCGACSYSVEARYLDGSIEGRSEQAWPLSGMSLTLYDASGATLATIAGLSPSACYGGESVAQAVSTTVTSGVARAELRWTDAHSITVGQLIPVNP